MFSLLPVRVDADRNCCIAGAVLYVRDDGMGKGFTLLRRGYVVDDCDFLHVCTRATSDGCMISPKYSTGNEHATFQSFHRSLEGGGPIPPSYASSARARRCVEGRRGSLQIPNRTTDVARMNGLGVRAPSLAPTPTFSDYVLYRLPPPTSPPSTAR